MPQSPVCSVCSYDMSRVILLQGPALMTLLVTCCFCRHSLFSAFPLQTKPGGVLLEVYEEADEQASAIDGLVEQAISAYALGAALTRQVQLLPKFAPAWSFRRTNGVLWAGLVLLLVQWSLFLRLTFWELSWDVMEPISYFFSSLWGIVAYCYFLVRQLFGGPSCM